MANYIKPFATNPDASVMTNDELANADELKRGFIPKSKADSRLIGKLIQNSTAGAYVLGEFTSSVGGVDVDPSNATTFSSDFQNALKTYITRHAPQSDLSGYQLKTEAATQHQAIGDEVAKKLDSTTASATYETKNNVASKITEATEAIDAKLAGKANTTHSHTIGNVTNLQETLDAKASTTWAQGELAKKANLANPVFTGTVRGTFNGSLTGDVTGNVSGRAGTATKAIQDANGNVIDSFYAAKTELAGKANTKHTHAIADVEELQTNLDNKVGTTAYEADKKTFATKVEVGAKVDTATYNQEKAGFATKLDISTLLPKTEAASTYETKTNVSAINTKVGQLEGKFAQYYDKKQVDAKVSSVYRYKGSVVNHAALPQSNQVIGDVYNVEDTGVNVAWDGKKWDDLGGTTDLSGYLSKSEASSTYATRQEMTTGLGGKADAAHTHAEADIQGFTAKLGTLATKTEVGAKASTTYVDQQLAAKAPLANPTFTGTVKGTFSGNLTGNATSATKATQDGAGKVIATTYATKAELGSYATTDSVTSGLAGKQDKGEYVLAQTLNNELSKKANASHTHTTAQVTGLDAALAGKQNKGDYATNAAVNGKININGARGLIAGYESIGNHTTITDSSPDSNETAAAVTVNNGSANVCWTKIVHLTSASPSVNLGSSWKWQNGTSPELKQNGFLVLCWCNTMGLAVYNNVQ